MVYNFKQISEHRHRMVHRYLVERFPDCEVVYDGNEGVDHVIRNGVTRVYLETKSCLRIIKGGRVIRDGELLRTFRFGRFKFEQKRGCFPYKRSQHEDLVDLDGWYILVVDNRVRGVPARVVDAVIHGDWRIKHVVWDTLIFLGRPDWLETLKKQVYGGGQTHVH